MTRLKDVAGINLRTLSDGESEDLEFRYVDISTVGRGCLVSDPQAMTFADAPSRARRLVRQGDTLVSTVRTYLRAVWPVRHESDDLVVSTGFAVVTPRASVVPRFLGWWAESDALIEEIVARSVGVSYPAITAGEIGEIPIDLPAVEEQLKIADFLDAETARIDALIKKKREMIEALASRFAAAATERILRGLNPVTGSGGLPRDWSRPRLGVALQLHRGYDLPNSQRREGAVPVVSSGGISGSHTTPACEPPGVVTGRYGTVGDVYFVDVPYWPLNTTLFVSDFRGQDPRWVYHLLRVLPLNIDEEKSAVTGINRNIVGQLFVPLPPRDVQTEIARDLDAVEDRQRNVAETLEEQVRLLGERRHALVTAAVTGQLDVRPVAA